jgi:undecaprenyl diphosphate synthase
MVRTRGTNKSEKRTTKDGTGELLAITREAVPKHIAIIMDGNGRWAKRRLLPRVAGHKVGGETVRKIVTHARKLGVSYLTLYAFSTENWDRPQDEVGALMNLFARYLDNELPTLMENGVRFRVIGDRDRLQPDLRKRMESCEEKSKHLDGLQLLCAISYGARDELVNATRSLARKVSDGSVTPEQITEKMIAQELYAPDVPDPDLLIRTSGEYRLSNFLLWQLAYSELIITDTLWPDFDEIALENCIREYLGRDRRYGKVVDVVSD